MNLHKTKSNPSVQQTTVHLQYSPDWIEIYVDNYAVYRGDRITAYVLMDLLHKIPNLIIKEEPIDFLGVDE